jgi:hypothetical protein
MGAGASSVIPEPKLPEGSFGETVAQGAMPEQAPGAGWATPPTSERDLANVFAPPGGLLNLEQPTIRSLPELMAPLDQSREAETRRRQGIEGKPQIDPFIGPDVMSEDLPLWPGGARGRSESGARTSPWYNAAA